jgi:ferric-dicitrate binding protein FerR (iron transport regulator)
VQVVGTSFSVLTENTDTEVEVFVKTGKVVLSDKSGEQSLVLDPGYIGIIDSEKSAKSINNNPNYLAWNTGKLVYKGEKLGVVLSDLRKYYNMNVVADDPSILEFPWHSPIDYESRDIIISLICTSFNLSYIKDGDIYHLVKK